MSDAIILPNPDSMIHKAFAESGKLMDTTINWLKYRNPYPFDARIEYLESTGTQYIDTGIAPTNTTSATLRGYFKHNNGTTRFGSRKAGAQDQFCIVTTSQNQIRVDIGTGDYISQWIATTSDAKEIKMDAGTNSASVILIDGTVLTQTLSGTVSFSTSFNLYVFAFNNGGAAAYASSMRVYSCSIYNGSTLVRDFIPVRVGSVGYLYDKVSGQLFGNAGTGEFVCGPDIVPIEYLASTGTQYVDTGVTATGYTAVTGEFSDINYPAGTDAEILFGSREDAGGYKLFSASVYSDRFQFYYNGSSNLGSIFTTANRAVIRLASNEAAVNSLTKQITSTKTDYVRPIYIFRRSCPDGVSSLQCSGGRLHSFQIQESGVLVRDLIPARAGQTGYLYDKVSLQLFANKGTGDFILGPDL